MIVATANDQRRHVTRRQTLAAVEVLVAAIVIVLDLAIPSLAVLTMAAISLVVRRQGFASIGFRRLISPVRAVGGVCCSPSVGACCSSGC